MVQFKIERIDLLIYGIIVFQGGVIMLNIEDIRKIYLN